MRLYKTKVVLGMVILLGSLILSSCSHQPIGYKPTKIKNVMIVTAEQVQDQQLTAKAFSLSFGIGEDGTEIIERYLEEVKKQNAPYVSDISIRLIKKNKDQYEIWSTAIIPVCESIPYNTTRQIPGKNEYRHVMKPVSRTITEYVSRSKSVTRPVQRTKTVYKQEIRYESRYDYSSKSYRNVPVTRSVPTTVTYTAYENRIEWERVPVTRMVTRYEYQYENKYIPPRLETITRTRHNWKLVEKQPERISSIEKAEVNIDQPNVITGIIYKQSE